MYYRIKVLTLRYCCIRRVKRRFFALKGANKIAYTFRRFGCIKENAEGIISRSLLKTVYLTVVLINVIFTYRLKIFVFLFYYFIMGILF